MIGRLAWAIALVLFAAPLSVQPQRAHLIVHETSLGPRSSHIVRLTFATSASYRPAYIVKTARGEAVVVDGVVCRMYESIPRTVLTEAGITPPIRFSPDGKRVAYVARSKDKSFVVVDGAEGSPFDRIPVGAPVFSPDSRRVAYIAEKAGKHAVVVIDGVQGPTFDWISETYPRFTRDGRHLIYTAHRGERSVIVVDGKEVDEGEYLGTPVYSDSGERIAYVKKTGDTWSVVVDGVAGPPYRSIGNNLVFSRDGRHFLYRGGDSLDYVVVDGVQSKGYGTIQENSYEFSRDGSHVAFVAHEGRQALWVLDGTEGVPYEWVSSDAAFSPDGRRLTYVAQIGSKRVVVIGSREGESFDDIPTFPRFAADGRVVYVAKRGTQQYVVVDTTATAFDEINDASVTSAGHLVVVSKRAGMWRLIIDGVEGKPYPEPVGPVVMSNDGKRIAYAASAQSKRVVVIDSTEGALYDKVEDLALSADGRHVIYTAQRLGKYVVVVDGLESPAYDEIVSFPMSDELAGESFTFLARRGSVDFRVTVPLGAH